MNPEGFNAKETGRHETPGSHPRWFSSQLARLGF